MALNYAEQWSPELLQIKIQETLTSPFIVPNVKWLGAKTFHFTQMSVSGYKPHTRGAAFNKGTFTQNDNEFKVNVSRDISFLVDIADVDETNATASIENIAKVFQMTQAAPEHDAYFFSKVTANAGAANAASGLKTETAKATYTAANVLTKIKAAIAKVKKYRRSIIVYIASWMMDLLEVSTELDKKIEMTQVADGGIGIETRVTSIDSVPIIEAIEDERFYDKFNFEPTAGGFEPIAKVAAVYAVTEDVALATGKTYYTRSGEVGAYIYTKVATPDVANIATYYEITNTPVTGSKKINILIATPETTVTVPKIASIYYFAPGTHTDGDGYLFQTREDYDTFTFPNGKDNVVDSVFVDLDTAEHA